MSDPTAVQPARPHDLLAEGARARKLSADVEGIKSLVEGTRLVNDSVLVHVLFSLWDCGFYEYSLTHPWFDSAQVAQELGLSAPLLKHLLDYLVGRGIVQTSDGKFGLTDRGARLSNVLLRGTMDLYVGGYGPLLSNIAPLLRNEISLSDFKNLRSGRHTVRGTEQLICVRTVPAVSKVMAQKKLRGVLNLATRTGEFLIELARSDSNVHGIGIDKAADRIDKARAHAAEQGVGERVAFVRSEIGREPLPLDGAAVAQIDSVVALYFLHEVARHGRRKVVDLVRQLKAILPGRLFLFLETLPMSAAPPAKKPPVTFSQLDYLLIHHLRDQGLPLPADDWKSILAEAGANIIEVQELYLNALYIAEL